MAELEELAVRLRSDSVQERAGAAEQLCYLAESAQGAAAALVAATGDEESVSRWAVAALEELGPPAADAAAQLIELAKSDVQLVAYWAITLLGRLGTEAAGAEAVLITALGTSPHSAVRERAAWALGRLGPLSNAAAESLRQASHAASPRLARLAAQALASS
jgi:HEAT repeat protein